MIMSMTGFGRGETARDGNKATVELTSVNSRYFESQLRLPRELSSLEPRFREILAGSFSRGKISCVLAWEPAPGAGGRVSLNEQMAAMYQEIFRRIKEKLNLPGEVAVADFVGLPEILTFEPEQPDSKLVYEIAEQALVQAAATLKEMRRAEGEKIHQDLSHRLSLIIETIARVERESEGNVEAYRQKLQARIKELFGESGYDPQRLAEEVAYLAERSDITEECVRLRIHAEHFRDALESAEPVGRRLNFLMQEMNREANTIGSKAGSAEISSLAVTIKEELEKIREQIQNVE